MVMSDARSTGSTSGINNSFDLAKKIEIDLNFKPKTARFIADVSLINIYCSSLSSAPKPDEITIKISEDEYALSVIQAQNEDQMTGWEAVQIRKKHPALQEAWNQYKTLWRLCVENNE